MKEGGRAEHGVSERGKGRIEGEEEDRGREGEGGRVGGIERGGRDQGREGVMEGSRDGRGGSREGRGGREGGWVLSMEGSREGEREE